MGIKRYYASQDTTITNAYKLNLRTRGTGSNMGASDVLEMFNIYAQESTSSQEAARILIKFPVDTIVSTDRTNSVIPGSGSVSWYLRLFNAKHSETLPKAYSASINAISRSWTEGTGLDMEDYTDIGYANWLSASATTAWTATGSDYHTAPEFTQYFDDGTENLEVNVSDLVEQWLDSSKNNDGFLIRLSGSFETGTTSYYTKRFFARGTEFWYYKPVLEARWDSSKQDDRNNFYYSSSLASAADNLNTLYFYNFVRGQLKDIPGISAGNPIYVDLYSGSSTTPTGSALVQSVNTPATGGWVSTGIYSASVCLTSAATPLTYLHDVWYSGSTQYFTGTIEPVVLRASPHNPTNRYVTSVTNLKKEYHQDENPTFRLFIRNKNWQPTVYTVATTTPETLTIDEAFFKVMRVTDNFEVIGYGTGSDNHTKLSFDVSGNYCDLDLSTFEPDYMYGLKFVYYINGNYQEQPEIFKFRVVDEWR